MSKFGTKICKSSPHFCPYVGEFGTYFCELHSNFGAEVGELEFHLGLGEDGGCSNVFFGREAVPVDGRNGVHQFGRVFVAKDANEFVCDAKPSCFIKCHCVAFPQGFQGRARPRVNTGHHNCGKDTPMYGELVAALHHSGSESGVVACFSDRTEHWPRLAQ